MEICVEIGKNILLLLLCYTKLRKCFLFLDGFPVGTRKCNDGSLWEEPVWILDCDAMLEELNTTEQTNSLQVATSDISSADENRVNELVRLYIELSGTATDPDEVGEITA